MSYALGILELERRRHAVETADEGVRALAQQRVDEGNAAFRAGDYATANRRYDEAFILLPTANMLVIIGLTMQRLGRFRDASYRYIRYLRENPDGDRRGQVEEQLAEVQAAMELAARPTDMTFTAEETSAHAREFAGGAPAPPAELPPALLAAKRAAVQSVRQVQQAAPLPTDIRNPYAETNYAIWIATGVGVVGLVGLGWWLTRRKKAPKKNRRRRRR